MQIQGKDIYVKLLQTKKSFSTVWTWKFVSIKGQHSKFKQIPNKEKTTKQKCIKHANVLLYTLANKRGCLSIRTPSLVHAVLQGAWFFIQLFQNALELIKVYYELCKSTIYQRGQKYFAYQNCLETYTKNEKKMLKSF